MSAQSDSYSAIVEQCRRGGYEQALREIELLPDEEIRRSVEEVRRRFAGRGQLTPRLSLA